LTSPERIRFRYQLTGVDDDWVEAGTARSATYGSIPAGDHVFRVLASSPEGVWGSRPATVALAVHPYFWQTNWFLAAVTAFLAGGGVWMFRRATVRRLGLRLEYMRQQHAVDQERARIAQDIHDELGANLTSIGLLADMGARHKADPAALARDLNHISRTARSSVAAMDAIVWALNPRNDSLDHFANYVAQFTRDFFGPTPLRTRLELPANLPAQPLTTETRHQLFLLVKESFNNIVRHAQATEVRLELACENGHLHLIIADNGKGLPQLPGGEGHNGLTNLRERIARLGGDLRVASEPGRGTRLDFTMPLPKGSMN
jgi:signal transduction histidine kinase